MGTEDSKGPILGVDLELCKSYLAVVEPGQPARVVEVVGAENPQLTAALTGSGSWGGEVACFNLVRPTSRVVVLSSGLFGDRLAEMARLRGAQVQVVRAEEGVIPWNLLKEALSLRPDVFGVVHVESSIGVEIPLVDVLELARKVSPHSFTVVDAVASAGAVPLKLQGLADYVYSASQKGFEAPAGLAPIAVSPRALAYAESPSYYGDLHRVWGFWERGMYHHTPAVPLIEALERATRRLLAEGLEHRRERMGGRGMIGLRPPTEYEVKEILKKIQEELCTA